MRPELHGKSLLTIKDLAAPEIEYLLDLAGRLKEDRNAGRRGRNLAGRNIALLFEKPSTRTRCAFAVAAADEGAHPEYLGKSDIQLGKKETIEDTARVLGRMFDGIAFRGFRHQTVEQLARHSGVPVWNGLTDRFHPTQALADLMTIREKKGDLTKVTCVYVGDGRNNVATSLMIAAAKTGMNYRGLSPEPLQPDSELLEEVRGFAAESGAAVEVTARVEEGVEGADVIYTDVWASMGEEERISERIELLGPYRVDREMLEATRNSEVIFMHCLPSFHNGETGLARDYPGICETTDEVFESSNSVVFDQAENRMHTIKAVMVATLTK